MQREMALRNASMPATRRIEFRMGINLGDIIIDEQDIVNAPPLGTFGGSYGDAVGYGEVGRDPSAETRDRMTGMSGEAIEKMFPSSWRWVP
jgi:hypothetical protein